MNHIVYTIHVNCVKAVLSNDTETNFTTTVILHKRDAGNSHFRQRPDAANDVSYVLELDSNTFLVAVLPQRLLSHKYSKKSSPLSTGWQQLTSLKSRTSSPSRTLCA